MEKIFEPLGETNRKYFVERWVELEKGECLESLLVKDLDKLEMIQQAFEYEKTHTVDLSEFYTCIQSMKTEVVKKWAEELIEERGKWKKSQ